MKTELGQHISYELMMFYETFIRIEYVDNGTIRDGISNGALFESFLIHSRSLHEYFKETAKENIKKENQEKRINTINELDKLHDTIDVINKDLGHLKTMSTRTKRKSEEQLNNKKNVYYIFRLLKDSILTFVDLCDINKIGTGPLSHSRLLEYKSKILDIVV